MNYTYVTSHDVDSYQLKPSDINYTCHLSIIPINVMTKEKGSSRHIAAVNLSPAPAHHTTNKPSRNKTSRDKP